MGLRWWNVGHYSSLVSDITFFFFFSSGSHVLTVVPFIPRFSSSVAIQYTINTSLCLIGGANDWRSRRSCWLGIGRALDWIRGVRWI
jgi:hypothetical protein